MPRLDFPAYLDHVRAESERFRAVLAECDPGATVPSCPEWDAGDLLWHLGTVQHFWASMVEQRPAGPRDYREPPRPATYDDLLGFFDRSHDRLVAALAGAGPAEEAWTWSREHTVGFIYRRQAHEALIHRLDAELTTGDVTPLDPGLAADGVEEVLDVMFGGLPRWGSFEPLPHYVRVDCTDTDDQVWVQLGRLTGTDPHGVSHDTEDIHVVTDPGVEPDAVVEGLAGDLDAWLWRRSDGPAITVTGDRGIYGRFRGCVDHPID